MSAKFPRGGGGANPFSAIRLFEFGPVVQEEMAFNDFSYLELWRPFCSVERNRLCNFNRGYPEDQFCEIILNLDLYFRRCCLKDFSLGALVALVFKGAELFMQFC